MRTIRGLRVRQGLVTTASRACAIVAASPSVTWPNLYAMELLSRLKRMLLKEEWRHPAYLHFRSLPDLGHRRTGQSPGVFSYLQPVPSQEATLTIVGKGRKFWISQDDAVLPSYFASGRLVCRLDIHWQSRSIKLWVAHFASLLCFEVPLPIAL